MRSTGRSDSARSRRPRLRFAFWPGSVLRSSPSSPSLSVDGLGGGVHLLRELADLLEHQVEGELRPVVLTAFGARDEDPLAEEVQLLEGVLVGPAHALQGELGVAQALLRGGERTLQRTDTTRLRVSLSELRHREVL